MDTEPHKTFLEVNRPRHFARAADNLFITPSAVTARIQQLEGLLAAPLFIRNRNNLQLTEAGERLLPLAQSMLGLWQRTRQMVGGEGRRDLLALATTSNLWEILLRPHLALLSSLIGDGLRLHTLPTTIIQQQLSQGSIDLALLHETPPLAELEIVELGECKLKLYSHRSDTIVSDALNGEFIQIEWGEHFMRQLQQNYPDMAPSNLQLEPSHAAMEWMVSCGGSAYLAEELAQEYCRRGELFPVAEAEMIRLKQLAVFRADSPQRPRIEQLLGALKAGV